MSRKFHFLSWVLLLLVGIPTKNFGNGFSYGPMVKSFTKDQYGGGTQTWDISGSSDGLLFFANNDGLLVFDGNRFARYSLPGKSILRSLFVDTLSDLVYAGGQNEIGYFQLESRGNWVFHSLKNLLPLGYRGFEDVWSIKKLGQQVYFQTSQQVFVYDGKQIQAEKPSEALLENLFELNGALYLTDASGSIYRRGSSGFALLVKSSGFDISGMVAYKGNGLLVSCYRNGLFLLQGNSLQALSKDFGTLKESRIYKIRAMGSGYVVASSRSGVFFLDSGLQVVNNVTLKEGLQNNNVLSLFPDRNGNLWLGLDNGIDLVRLNYPFSYLVPDGLLKGTGYAMKELGNSYYFGTNNGLYSRTKGQYRGDAYQLIPGSEGQVWNLQIVQGKLFVCHHEGLFDVFSGRAVKVVDIRGCWKLLPLSRKPGYYILGTYNGLCLLRWNGTTLELQSRLDRFKESSRFLEEDESGALWVGHPYKGLYKLSCSADYTQIQQVKLYGKADGLPGTTDNYVFRVDPGLCFGTPEGVYKYKESTDKFEPYKAINQQLGNLKPIRRMFNGQKGLVWVLGNNQVVYIKPVYNGVEYSYTKRDLPRIDQNLVGGFEYLEECAGGNVFLGVESGFVHMDISEQNPFTMHAPKVMVTSIGSLNFPDSVYVKLVRSDKQFEFDDRSLEFSFSSPNAFYFKDLMFSTYLEGWEKSWSPWKPGTTREFSRLAYGDYALHVKARYMGLEGPETVIRFQVNAPWYLSGFARFMYLFFALIGIVAIVLIPQRRVKKEASRLMAEKDQHFQQQTEELRTQKELKEKELIELKNQQLQKELEHQARELASSTMHIVQKSEMLLSIKDKLRRISQISNDPKIKPEIAELIRNIDNDALIDKEWDKFELYFNTIHNRFTVLLKEKHPVLSSNDIKMCAYLRMNLSTKEIASLLNISVRGVEISRYRLRKKMMLENGVNLTEYLTRLEAENQQL